MCFVQVYCCVCVFVFALRSDSYSNTHIWAKCNSSQWNVLTTKRPGIALVDNRHTHLLPVRLYSPSEFDKHGLLRHWSIFCRFHHSGFFWGCLDLHMSRLYRFPKRTHKCSEIRSEDIQPLIQTDPCSIAIWWQRYFPPPSLPLPPPACVQYKQSHASQILWHMYTKPPPKRQCGVTFPAHCFWLMNEKGFGKLVVKSTHSPVLFRCFS